MKRYNGNGTNVVVPDEVVKIDKGVFSGQNQITGVILPKSVVEIGDYAFAYCQGPETFDLPEQLTQLSWGMFTGSTIESIDLPETVREVEDYASTRARERSRNRKEIRQTAESATRM